ncbi:MAG: transglutaminase domain-containing protein [Gemmatimonadetes bacterium]|nr:transglutaminase domain-containing protein [Gemmatimonadota bacterium]
MAWMGARRLTQTEASVLSSEAALRLAPGATWFALYSGETQVGQAGITVDTLSPGYQILETFAIETPADSGVLRATLYRMTKVSPALGVLSVVSRTAREGVRTAWTAAFGDGRLSVAREGTLAADDGLPIAVAPTTTAILPYRLALTGGLASDRHRTLPGYVGWPGTLMPIEMTTGRDSMAVFADSAVLDPASGQLVVAHQDSARARAVLIRADGPAERWWIDTRGHVAGIETAFGLSWRRTDFDLAASALRNRTASRAVRLRALLPPVTRVAAPDTTTMPRRYVLSRRDGRPLDPALLQPLSSGRQRLRGDTLSVTTDWTAPTGTRGDVLPRDPLAPDSLPAVRDFVARALGPTPPVDRELRIGRLVAAIATRVTLDTSTTAAVDAGAALATRRAQAEGMARLFVAAANAAGLEARLAIGIRPDGDGFASHAWAEVRDQGSWTAVDPAFGRRRAAASLIRLGSSGSTEPWQLLIRVLQLRITVVPDSQEVP